MRMVKLDGGTFRMGSSETEPGRKADEGPAHEVTLDRAAAHRGRGDVAHAVPQGDGHQSRRSRPRMRHRAQHRPVESVTWNEANEFCRKLTEMEKGEPWARKGWAYRLPTEAEWEYAARAGTETPFAFGDQIIFERHALFNWSERRPARRAVRRSRPRNRRRHRSSRRTSARPSPTGSACATCTATSRSGARDWYRPVYHGGGGQGPDRPRGRRPPRDPRAARSRRARPRRAAPARDAAAPRPARATTWGSAWCMHGAVVGGSSEARPTGASCRIRVASRTDHEHDPTRENVRRVCLVV